MSSANAPCVGASESGSSRRHSIETICQPAVVLCRITSWLNGSETTSRIRSKYAMAPSDHTSLAPENAILQPEALSICPAQAKQANKLSAQVTPALPSNGCPFSQIPVHFRTWAIFQKQETDLEWEVTGQSLPSVIATGVLPNKRADSLYLAN